MNRACIAASSAVRAFYGIDNRVIIRKRNGARFAFFEADTAADTTDATNGLGIGTFITVLTIYMHRKRFRKRD